MTPVPLVTETAEYLHFSIQIQSLRERWCHCVQAPGTEFDFVALWLEGCLWCASGGWGVFFEAQWGR